METHLPRVPNQKTYFSHHNSELPGRSPADAVSTEQAVENAMSTIREILTEERRKTRRHVLPDLAPHVPVEHLEPVRAQTPKRRVAVLSRLMNLRPRALKLKPHHAGWLAAFALVLWQPMPVLIAMFIGFWMVFLGYALFGPERMTHLRSRVTRRMARLLEQRRALPELRLRREPEPDVFADRPDPFERIAPKTR
tara:strand:+ start:277 stop:861 length:585 start_codon:yes stop_codon:yes gene_type:complete